MRNIFTLLLVLIFAISGTAQKQDYVWSFGGDGSGAPGIQGMQIDFKDSVFNVKEITLPHRNISSHVG